MNYTTPFGESRPLVDEVWERQKLLKHFYRSGREAVFDMPQSKGPVIIYSEINDPELREAYYKGWTSGLKMVEPRG